MGIRGYGQGIGSEARSTGWRGQMQGVQSKTILCVCARLLSCSHVPDPAEKDERNTG